MDKLEIIRQKQSGKSNREVARVTGYDRDTVSKYWNEYQRQETRLREDGADVPEILEQMFAEPKYQTPERSKRKYTDEMESLLVEILESEKQKKRTLGATHKQKLTNVQIHEKVAAAGYDIGKATINFALARLRRRQKEVYIRQEYEPGQRLEYDFGEVRLDCGEGVKTYHMAVFCAPAANFRWVYLYTNQKKDVFLDSHVRFFEMAGGCWREVVYDNMRNVVKKFIGRGEKELNPELIMLAAYYGFRTNVTNCFRGNEKGSVERSVEVTRNRIFADKHKFASLAAAQEYAESVLRKLNDDEAFNAEKCALLPYKPQFELGIISENHVNSYSLIVVDSVNYSVPEEFVGKTVTVKKYHDVLRVFCGNQLICAHKRAFGNDKYQIDIYHYLNTFLRKPGALRNSVVLRQTPKLKAIFDAHYPDKPRKFIEMFIDNNELELPELIDLLEKKTLVSQKVSAIDIVRPVSEVELATLASLHGYGELTIGGAHNG